MIGEFLKFLKEYKIVSLAVAFIMGEASTTLVQSLVKDVILPVAAPLMSVERWQEAVFSLGPVTISYGIFVADLLNFAIVAFVVFVLARKFLEMEKRAGRK